MNTIEPIIVTLTHHHLGQRYDVVLAQLLPKTYSRSRIQMWCQDGYVLQGDTVIAANAKIKKVMPITVYPQPEDSLKAFIAENLNLNIVYEDAYLAVINKPVGMVVHPGSGNWTGTLMNGLLYHYPQNKVLPRAGIVHRLDKDTSGLMVIAKDSETYNALVVALKERTVQRRYLAISHGVPAWLTQRIDMPIGRDPKLRTRMAILPGTIVRPSTGKPAMTDIRVLASNHSTGTALLECKLHTGRTHQIRVHLSSIRHALVGDSTYNGKPLLDLTRQALHAWSLSFEHPITGEFIKTNAEPPADLLTAFMLMGIDWAMLYPLLLNASDFDVDSSQVNNAEFNDMFEYNQNNQAENSDDNDDIFDFDNNDDSDEFNRFENFNDNGVEIIYVRE